MSEVIICKLLDELWDSGDLPKLMEFAPEWLRVRREIGQVLAKAMGVPSRADERWRYTSLSNVLRQGNFQHADDGAVAQIDKVPSHGLNVDAIPIVMVNGRLSAHLSDFTKIPNGLNVVSLADAIIDELDGVNDLLSIGDEQEPNGIRAANDGHIALGLLIRVDADAAIKIPIHIIVFETAEPQERMYHPRVVFDLERHTELTVIESHLSNDGSGAIFKNWVSQISLADGARLNHVKWQNESKMANHVTTVDVKLLQDATYNAFIGLVGASIARHDTRINVSGSGAHANVSGIYVGDGKQVHDFTTCISHNVPHTTSNQMVRGVLKRGARGVFLGKAIVARDAQKTDAQQLHNALLLDKTAEVNAKPELEIYADDVQCAHGNTIGDVDTDALFYMQARGISKAEAYVLLIEGFLAEVVEHAVPAPLQDPVKAVVLEAIR